VGDLPQLSAAGDCRTPSFLLLLNKMTFMRIYPFRRRRSLFRIMSIFPVILPIVGTAGCSYCPVPPFNDDMNTKYLLKPIAAMSLSVTLTFAAFAEEDAFNGTETPDAAADIISTSEVERPAVILPSVKEEPKLIRPGDIAVQPPKIVKKDNGELILVQYSTRSQKQNNQPETPAPAVDLPQQYRDFDAMNETERIAHLKRSIQALLTANTKRGVNTMNNTPHDVMLMTLPYGADAKVYQPDPQANPRDRNAPKGTYIYSMGALCWNIPCSGKSLLRTDGNKVIARVGTGYQRQPASFLAMLAMSNIMPNYELKVSGGAYTIAHLIASERMSVSKGMNLSNALIAFSFYGEAKDQWKNEFGETWNVEKMVTEELNRSLDQGTSDVTDWLLGLTSAVRLYESESKPIRGPMALAKKQLGTYRDFILSIQNDHYLWHPKFFLFKGYNPDVYETMYSSGHILRWLVYSLPEKDLQNPQVVRAVMSLAATVNRVPATVSAGSLSDKQLEGLAVSLHALAMYYSRSFKEDPIPSPAQPEKTVANIALVRFGEND
jgi:hypothetical protein